MASAEEVGPEFLPNPLPDEEIVVAAKAIEAVVVATNCRIVVRANQRLALALPFTGLRRIQFDIERTRPATLVIVPEHPNHEAQVLSIPASEIPYVTRFLDIVSRRLGDGD